MIDWDKVDNFSPHEFPENTSFAKPELFYRLNTLRKLIDRKIFPSPAQGALARMTGSPSSQHYAVDRLSTACDVFCEGTPIQNFFDIIASKLFTGIGLYLDTKGVDGLPWAMTHLDIRHINAPRLLPVIWIAAKVNGENIYYYPQDNPEDWSLLKRDILYRDKIKGKGTSKIA